MINHLPNLLTHVTPLDHTDLTVVKIIIRKNLTEGSSPTTIFYITLFFF